VIIQMTPEKNCNHHTQQQLENSNHTNHNHLPSVVAHTNGADNRVTSVNGAPTNNTFLKANMGGQHQSTAASKQQHVAVTSPTYNNVAPEISEATPSCESSPNNSDSSNDDEWDSGKQSEIAHSDMDKAGQSVKSQSHYDKEDNYYKAGPVTSTTLDSAITTLRQTVGSFSCDNRSNFGAMTHNFENRKARCISTEGGEGCGARKNSLTNTNSRKLPRSAKMKLTSSSAKAIHNNNFNPATSSTSSMFASDSPKQSKMEWLKSKRSDSDFCAQLPNNVAFKATASAVKIMRNSNDSLNTDFYSALCDNKLSIEASPAKSPRPEFKFVAATNDPPKSSIVTARCRASKLTVGFDMTKSLGKSDPDKPLSGVSAVATTGRGSVDGEPVEEPKNRTSLGSKSENSSFKNFFVQFTSKKCNPQQHSVPQPSQQPSKPAAIDDASGLVKSASMSNMFSRKYQLAPQTVDTVALNVMAGPSCGSPQLESKMTVLKIDEKLNNTQTETKRK
jgi:hypothetical protein